jgi:hypothetical protein
MTGTRFLHRVALALMLSAAVLAPQAILAADASDRSLESELADEIATRLIDIYNLASYAQPGFETFESLFGAYESLRKWQAYLEAIDAAKLPTSTGPYASIKSAVQRLGDASINEASIATAAIDALDGLGNWHADDQAQADLVIQHLGKLITELSDPRERLRGQSILAAVELDSDAPMAAAARIVAAVADIRRLDDSAQQLAFATKFGTMLQSLDAPRIVEVASELVAAVATPDERAALVSTLAGGFQARARARLDAAATAPQSVTDPLALAWSSHAPGSTLDPATVARTVGGGIDPLPVVVALANGVAPNLRQSVCTGLVDMLVQQGHAIRALNLRKALGANDCLPATALTLAADFVASDIPNLAGPLLDEVLARSTDSAELRQAAHTLERLGDVQRLAANAATLAPVLGGDLPAVQGRAAIRALLHDRSRSSIELDDIMRAAIEAYAPAGAMYALLLGKGDAAADGVEPADLELFRDIGKTLAAMPSGERQLLPFVTGSAPAATRLAAAAGFTGDVRFDASADSGLTSALKSLAASAEPGDDRSGLLASLGDLDLTTLTDAVGRDALLLRAARQRAWSGDSAEATALAERVMGPTAATRLVLDVASIEAIVGPFETGVAAIRQHAETRERVEAFRFVARQRAGRLDIHGWIEGGMPLDLAPPTLINASTAGSDGPVIHYDDRLSVRPSGATLPSGKPVLPDLGVDSSDVTRSIPFPTGGAAGIVVGGEGRYVRLGGFDSPYFDGESNNGVRDYVYEQNKTITPEFIFLNSGVFTIADVIAAIGRDQADAITLLPDGAVRFNRPLAIGSEATLILSGEEVREIQLNATTGAFLVNAGKLDIVGVRVVGFDVEKNAELRRGYETAMHKFRPFLLSWSGSETNLADSEFVALGYSAGRSYGVTFNSGPVDDYFHRADPAPPTGIVVNNSFDNLYYGFYAYEATDVQLVGNEYRDSIIYGIDPHDRSQRLNISLNTAYATLKKHGIIISREVNDSFIIGNLSFDNYGSGTMLDRSSIGTLVFANTLRGNHGDGMAVFESPCTIVGMNDVSGNNRAGIKVRNSWDVLLLQNLIEGNKGTAIEGFISDLTVSDGSAGRNFTLDPYQPVTSFSAIANAVRGNGAGIQAAGVSEIELYANQFRNQSGRLVAGDLSGLQGLLLQRAGTQPTLISTNCRPVLQPIHGCPFIEAGLIGPSRFTTSESGDFCLGDTNTAQSQAFSTVQQ